MKKLHIHIALFDNLFLIQREVNALKHPALLFFPSSTADLNCATIMLLPS
jgi:hypothetical protein